MAVRRALHITTEEKNYLTPTRRGMLTTFYDYLSSRLKELFAAIFSTEEDQLTQRASRANTMQSKY